MTADSKDKLLPTNLKRDAFRHCLAGLLATLALGLGFRFWFSLPPSALFIATTVFCGFIGLLMLWLSDHLPQTSLGAANRVTIFRAALVANLAAIAVFPESLRENSWQVTGLMIFALALDGVDGQVARKYALASPFGARLDQELDALFTLVLSFAIYRSGQAGTWILLAGLWHYVFYALRYSSPIFRNTLPFSQRRRAVCALTLAGLIACLAPSLAPPLSSLLALFVLGLLSFSFLIDIAWLWRLRKASDLRNP